MGTDLRVPLGALFCVLGLLLTAYGAATPTRRSSDLRDEDDDTAAASFGHCAEWKFLRYFFQQSQGFQRHEHELSIRRNVRRRSEEHTSELQSRLHLVCRLLLEKKKITPVSYTVAAVR